ncbi:guanine nucleotide exchange protein for ADP-robosylation factor [Podochytrium sp. JEL0797]|nr:guanine nucleotide exchange protein for ADP-robosylation factor [Podochytrium sp. JEL0797]
MTSQGGGATFIKHTLEQFAKEGKKLPALLSSSKQALNPAEDVNNNGVVSPEPSKFSSLAPSGVAVRSNSAQFRAEAEEGEDGFDTDKNDKSSNGIVGQVVDTICDAFAGETTDDKLQLQIVKALMNAISSSDPKSAIHGVVLLRAVRTTFNIFLFSKSQNTQMLAQTTLQQMVQTLFSKVPAPKAPRALVRELSNIRASMVGTQDSNEIKRKLDPLNQTYKDLHLVFRALCKMSMKPVPPQEGNGTDLKSPTMRSKLLSLHLINMLLSSHLYVFLAQTPCLFPANTTRENSQFVYAIKQHLCLTLSRNTVSPIPHVFDVSMEIFGKSLVGLRAALKRELSVVFTEIVLPIAEAKTAVTFHQRTSLLKALLRILSDPSADGGKILVEIYLNYDCDLEASAQENVWERLINTLSMLIQEHNNSTNSPLVPMTIPSGISYTNGPPSLMTASLATYTKDQIRELNSTTGDYNELKRRGLELLVRGVLRPLVTWITAKIEADAKKTDMQSTASDKDADAALSMLKETDKPFISIDDPTQFQNLKHRKQVLLEGIKRFNTKPKKVNKLNE